MSRKTGKKKGKIFSYLKGTLAIGALAFLLNVQPVYAADGSEIPPEETENVTQELHQPGDVLSEDIVIEAASDAQPIEVASETETIEAASETETIEASDAETIEAASDALPTETASDAQPTGMASDTQPTGAASDAQPTGTLSETQVSDTQTEESTGETEITDAEEEDASMELPDGTAYVENIGVDMFGSTILTYTNTATGNGTHTGNAIQNAFDAAIEYALGKTWEQGEAKVVTVVVENGEYLGDLNLVNTMGGDSFMDALLEQYGLTHSFFEDFTFVIRSSDALDENGNLSSNGAGGVRVKGNVLVDNLNVVFAGLSFGLDNSITVRNASTFAFYGTAADDVVDIYVDSAKESVHIDLGAGDDALISTIDQKPAFSVDVSENVITQLKLPENILNMLAGMAEAELQNVLANGISPSTSPTLNSLMDGLDNTAKATLEGEILALIKEQLEALGENLSNVAVEIDVTVNGGEGHDRVQVTVNNNSNLDLMPSLAADSYGIASLALQMDMSRTNVTVYGEADNDQILVDGNWKGMYQTMLLHKAFEELTEATLAKLNDETAEVKLYGGADDDTLQINTDYAFTTVWKAKAYMDGGDGVDRTNFAGAVNDGILAGLIPQDVEQIKKAVNGDVTTWTLDAMKAWTLVENNILHIEQEFFWINRTFEIDNTNVETFTDALANKFGEDIEWTASGYQEEKITAESYKDYTITITEEMISNQGETAPEFSFDVRDIFTNAENPENPEYPGDLTQLIINLMCTDTVTINKIYAPGWTVLISGFDMILGDITAGDLFVSALVSDLTIDGTIPTQDTNIEMQVQDTNNTEVEQNLDETIDVSIKSYLYSYSGKSSIIMEGITQVDGVAVITSSLTMDQGFVNLPDIANLLTGGTNPNIVVYKEGLAEVKILNDITAAAIQISAITNVDIDAEFVILLPLSGGVAKTNTYITVGGGTEADRTTLLATAGNVWLNAVTNIRIASNARAFGGVPLAAAVSYVDSATATTVTDYAEIISQGDADIQANSVTNLDADSTGAAPYSVAVDVNSGVFPVLVVGIVTTKAEVAGNANATSVNGDINVNSDTRLEARAESLSVPGQGQESAFKMLAAVKVFEYYAGIPQGSFIQTKVPFANIVSAIKNYFNTGTMGATDDNLYQPADKQFVGAFGVAYIDNDNQAIVNTAGNVSALSGDVNITANADTIVDVRADGSLYKTAVVLSFQHQPNNAVGVGVGVNIITHNNIASYKKGHVEANGLKVTANSYTPVALIVKAGHVPTESKLGIGGAVAVNVYSGKTEATVEQDAEAELGNGSLTVTAYQDGDLKIIGDASGRRATFLDNLMIGGTDGSGTLPRKGSVGFGTGIAVNVTGIDVTAKVTGAIAQRDGTKLSDIFVSSAFDGTEYIEARAGASAGVAVVPVVLVNISGASALTEVDTGTTLITSGNANIHSEVRMIRTLIADADTVANQVGFGGTFLINVTDDTAESYLYSSVTSDADVNVTAETISRMDGKSYASSKGAQASLTGDQLANGDTKWESSQQKGKADQFADKNLTNGAALAGNVDSRNTNSSKITSKMNNRQMATTAEGQVQVAAGFGLNIQSSKSVAGIGRDKEAESSGEDGEGDSETESSETIITAKNVRIETGNDTDGILHVSAAAVKSSVAVGVAVGINMVDYTNQVILGNASVKAETLTLQSKAIEIAQLKETEQLVEELVRFLTDVIGVEKFLQSIIHYEQNNKELPISEEDLDAKYDTLDEMIQYFEQKEFNDSYEDGGEAEESQRTYESLTDDEKALVKEQLVQALTTAILGGQTADVAETAVSAIVESLATKIKEAMTLDNFLVSLLTGRNMFAEAFAQGSTLFNGAVPRIQMALAQYLNSKYGGAEEMDGVGHKISTQTVSGAGASNVGVAGSVAILLVNGKTLVTIMDRETLPESGKDIVVDGLLNVSAETVQKIYTTATVSAHEFGVKKDRLASAIASANASGSSNKHQTSTTDKLTASGSGVGVGASVAFAKATNVVEAIIGENRDVIAGDVNVYANLRNDVETISVAGQDPVARRDSIFNDEEMVTPPQITPGQAPTTEQTVYYGTDPQMTALDASVAVGMSDNTITAKVGKNTNLITNGAEGNLTIGAYEHGEGYAQSSGFAAGSKAAVGASAAANIAKSEILADFGGMGIVKGNAVIEAKSYNEDTAYALATSTGALVDRILQKVGDIQRLMSLGTEKGISNTISNMLMNQLNGILAPITTNLSRNPVSTTLLTMLGIQVPASTNLPSSGTGANTSQNLGTSLQVAAAVGVNLTQHHAKASVTGKLQAANVDVVANNVANYRAVASGFNVVIFETGASYKISTAIAVSQNQNTANAVIDGEVNSRSDVNLLANTSQNMDGTYKGLLTAQALSGGFGGTALPDGMTLTGAFAGSFGKAVTKAEVKDNAAITAAGNVNVIALDWSKQAVRAGSASVTANSALTAGASVAVIDSKNEIHALIGKNAVISGKDLVVQALMLNVNEEDYIFPLDKSILFTTGANTDEEDKGIIHISLEPGNEGFGVNLETKDILALVDAINYFATVNYYAEAISAEIAVGGTGVANIAGAVAVVLVENIVEAIIDDAANITLTGDLTVDAQADTIARVISGSAAAGVSKVGTGLGVAVLDEKNQITAHVGTLDETDIGTIQAANVLVNAKNREEVLVINVGTAVVAGAAGIGGTATYAGNEGIVSAGIGSNYEVTADSVDVQAANESDIKVITTSPTIAAGAEATVAAGGSMVIIDASKVTESFVGNKTEINAVNDINVKADTSEKLLNVSASLSATTGVGAGAATVDTVGSSSTTKAFVGNSSNLNSENGSIRVLANADSELYNILAAVSASRNLAVGAVHMMNVLDRTVVAEVGIGTILEALNGDVEIMADADSFIVVPTVVGSVAGTAGGNGLVVTILAEDEVRAHVGDFSVITAGGVVKIIADNYQELYEAALAVSAGTTVSAGGSLVNLIVENKVEATTGNFVSLTGYNRKESRDEKFRGINIQAFNYTRMVVANAGGAVAAGSVSVNGIVQNVIVKNQVIAQAGKHNALNVANVERNGEGAIVSGDHAAGSSDQGIVIEADDESDLYIISGGLGVSTSVGVGVGTQALVYDSTVTAGIGDGSLSFAKADIDVLAYSTNNVWQVNASLTASGTVAVDTSANVIVFENETKAYLGGEATAANIFVVADSVNEVTQILVSLAGSETASVVPMAQVVYFESVTEAYTLDSAVLTASGDVVIKALSKEDLNSDSGNVAAATAGIAGTVIVAVTEQVTRAYTGTANTITATNIYINAYDDYDYLIVNAGLSAGGVAVGVNAGVNVSFGTVSAFVGDNSVLNASNDVEVTAVSERTITMYGMNASAASGAAVGVTVQVVVNGGKVNQDSADEINKYLSADKINAALAYGRDSEHVLHAYLTAREDVLAGAMEGDGVKKTDTSIGTETGDGFDFDAETGYYDQEDMEAIENSESNLDKNGTTDLTFHPESNTDIEGAAGLYDELPESYKELAADNQKDTVYAAIGAGTVVTAGNDILVSADDILTIELLTGSLSASSTASIGAGMAVIVANTEVTATVGADAVLTAGGDIQVFADGKYVLSAVAMNGSVSGNAAVSGTVAAIDIYSNIEATMKGDVKGAQSLYVTATMENSKLNAQTLSASASGTASVPVSIAMVLMNGRMEAGISGAAISNVTNIYVSTRNHFAPTVESLAAGASVVAVRGSIALAINRQKQYTYIDEASSVTGAQLVKVTADYDSAFKPVIIGVGAGKVSIGLQAVIAIDTPEILTYIGVNPTKNIVAATNTVEAGQVIVGHTVVTDIQTAGAFASGGMVAADVTVLLAMNRISAISAIRGMNIAADSVEVYADMDAAVVSEVLSAQAGGLTIGGTAVVSQLWADNQAWIETTGSTITAGTITVRAGAEGDANEMSSEATGLAAGVGGVVVRVNAAIADNKAANVAKLFGTGTVNASGEVKALAYMTAVSDAEVLAGNLSVTASVGAQFALALLRAEQYAVAGDGGTLTAEKLTAAAELNNTTLESTATAKVTNISGSMVAANANVAVAINESRSEARAGADTLVVNGAIDVQSKGNARVQAKAEEASLGIVTAGAQVTYAYANGIFDSWLYVGKTGEAASVYVATTYNTHANAVSIPTGFGVLNIKGNAAVAKVDGEANAKIQGAGSLTVEGTAQVLTSGSATAAAEVPSVQMVSANVVKIGINVAVAVVEQKQTSEVSIANLNAQSLTAYALLNGEGEKTTANVGSADNYVEAQVIDGEVNVAYARNSAVAEALISGTNVVAGGAIVVRSEGTSKAEADRYNPEAEVSLLNVNVIHTHAVTDGRFEAKAAFGSGTSSAASLTVETLFDIIAEAAAEQAGSVINYASLGVNSAYAKTTQEVKAGVETAGTLNITGDVNVRTKGHARADAVIRTGRFGISAVNVAGNVATVYADAVQNVWFKVTGTSNIGGNLNVEAILETRDGKESGGHTAIEPQDGSGVKLSLINKQANVLTTESRMDTIMEVIGGTQTTVGGNLNVNTNLTTVARTTGNDAGINVAFASAMTQVLDPYVQNALDIIFDGNIKVNGNFAVNAVTDSIAQVYVKNPTFVGAVSNPVLHVSSQIGTSTDPNRITITFNEGTSLYAKGNIDVLPVNKTYAGIKLENTNNLNSVAGIVIDTNVFGTETHSQTDILVGANAVLKSEKKLTLDALNSSQAQPVLDMTKNIGIFLSSSTFTHKNTIQSDVTIDIGKGAVLDAWEGLSIYGDANVYHKLAHSSSNSGFIGSGDIRAELEVTRNVNINIKEDARLQVLSGALEIIAATGADDSIDMDVLGNSAGFIAFGMVVVRTTFNDTATVNIDQGASLRINAGDIKLYAKTGIQDYDLASKWNAHGLGADAEVYTDIFLNQTAIVRIGENLGDRDSVKDVTLRGVNIIVHAGLGDMDIFAQTEAEGDDSIGDVLAKSEMKQELNVQTQAYNVYAEAVDNVYYYATGYLQGFNSYRYRVETATDIGIGDSDAATILTVDGQMKVVIDERYYRYAGTTSSLGQWFAGWDAQLDANGNTGYVSEMVDYENGTFVDKYRLNKKSYYYINDKLTCDINMDTYDAGAPLAPEIILDIYENADGSVAINAYGYGVDSALLGERNIPKVWVENGILYMEALELTLQGSVEITIINRTSYALSTPGVTMNGTYGDGEYFPSLGGHNEFRYFTTNDKDLYITRGIGNTLWRFKTVEFYWIGDGQGKVYLSTDVEQVDTENIDIVINEDGSYTTSRDDYLIAGTDSTELFRINGNDIVMTDVYLSAGAVYLGGIYLAEDAKIPNVEGLEHVHEITYRTPRNVTITNNSDYNLVLGRMYGVLSFDILSNNATDLTLSSINGSADSSIKWADGVSGNLYAISDNQIMAGTLIIRGAKQVGTEENPFKFILSGANAYLDIESSESIHFMGYTVDGYVYDEETGTTSYRIEDFLKFKHLKSKVVKLHAADGYAGIWLIPVCTESGCADIVADTLGIEHSTYGAWHIGTSERPLLADVDEIAFTALDTKTGEAANIVDIHDIYITATGDLTVDMNQVWLWDDDGEKVVLQVPNGSLQIRNNHISNKFDLIVRDDLTFVNGGYTWTEGNVFEVGGNLTIGGDFHVDGDTGFTHDKSVIVEEDLWLDSPMTMSVKDITVGKQVISSYAQGPVTIEAIGDIVVGSGIAYSAYPVTLTSKEGDVKLLGKEWLSGVDLVDGGQVYINAAGEIIIGEGNGTIDQGSDLYLNAEKVTLNLTNISQGTDDWAKTYIIADAEDFTIHASSVSGTVTNTGDIKITAKNSYDLALETAGAVDVAIESAGGNLDITAGTLATKAVSIQNGTWNIANAVTLDSLYVTGIANLKAPSWNIGTLGITDGMANLDMEATTGDISVGALSTAVYSDVKLTAKNDIFIGDDITLGNNFTAIAGNDITINGDVIGAVGLSAEANITLTAGEDLTVNGTIKKLDTENLVITAKNITAKRLESGTAGGTLKINALENMTFTEEIQFAGDVYDGDTPNTEPFELMAGGKLTTPTFNSGNGKYVSVIADEIEMETVSVGSRVDMTADSLLKLDYISVGEDGQLTLTATTLQNAGTMMYYDAVMNVTVAGGIGTKENPWDMDINHTPQVNIDADGEVWIGLSGSFEEAHYTLSESTGKLGIVGTGNIVSRDVYVEKANGSLEVETVGTTPRLHVDVPDGDLGLHIPDMNIEYVNASGDVTIYTENGMDQVARYGDNEDTRIQSGGDIRIVSKGDIGSERNSEGTLQEVNLVYTGDGKGKVYLEAATGIYVALDGYEDVEIGGDAARIYSMTANGDLNVVSDADLTIEKMTAAGNLNVVSDADLTIETMTAAARPNVYLGANSRVTLAAGVDVKLLLNDDATRISTAEELARLLGAALESDGTITLKGNVVLSDVIILNLDKAAVLYIDLNGYTITQSAENVLMAVESGTVRIYNGELESQATASPMLWLGNDGNLKLYKITASGYTPVHAVGGTVTLEDNVILENTDTKGVAINPAGAVNIALTLSGDNEVSLWQYDAATGKAVMMKSTNDASKLQTLIPKYYRVATSLDAGSVSYPEADIVIQLPDTYDAQSGEIVYDGTAQEIEVWLIGENGAQEVAKPDYYQVTYEKWNGTDWEAITGAPTEVGTYRVKIELTEAGIEAGLNVAKITPADGVVFEITQAAYAEDEVVAKESIEVAVTVGEETTLKELLNNNPEALFENLPDGAVVTIDEWEETPVFDEATGSYVIRYTVVDNVENPNQVITGTIEVNANFQVDVNAISYTSPNGIALLPEAYAHYDANKDVSYGVKVDFDSTVPTTISYSLDGVNWQYEPFIVNEPGEYLIYYRIEDENGYVYTNSYWFAIHKADIGDYVKELLEVELEDVNGNVLEWDYAYGMSYSGTMAKEGRYLTIREAQLMAERGWKLEYRLSEAEAWKEYDGSKFFLTNAETIIYYRISGDETFETTDEGTIEVWLDTEGTVVDIIVSEDGTIRVEGMTPQSIYNYVIYDETDYEEIHDSGLLVVDESGIVYLDTSMMDPDRIYDIFFEGMRANVIDEDTVVYYERYVASRTVVPGNPADLAEGNSGIVSEDGAKASATLNIPDLDEEWYQGYVILVYDETTGDWEYLGGITPDYDAMKDGMWNSPDYMKTLQDVYNELGGNGAKTERIKVVYFESWLFEESEDYNPREDFENRIALYTDGDFWKNPDYAAEGATSLNLEYMVYIYEEDQPDLRDITIRIEYPDGSYEVYDNIFDYPIRVYDYDANYKLAKVIATDADGNEIELLEDLYNIVYTRVSSEEAAAFALRAGSILPKEAGYLYRATIVLTEEAMKKFGLTESNLQNATVEFIIGNPKQESVEAEVQTKPMSIIVRQDEVVNPKAADAFIGLRENQTVVVEAWASGVSFKESGTYTYRYKLFTYYIDKDPIITEGELTLVVEVLSNEVSVNGFGEDTVADPNKTHELTVVPVDVRTILNIQYSEDGINWQTETFKYSKPGTYVVYYRVIDCNGKVIASGMDDITLTAMPSPVKAEVVSPKVEAGSEANHYEGTLGKDNSFKVDITVTSGNKEDYKVEYSKYVPIMENGVEVGFYWSDYSEALSGLTKGENLIRVRVQNIRGNEEYYEEYEQIFYITMVEGAEEPGETPEPEPEDKPDLKPEETQKPSVPQTGDTTDVSMLMFMLMISGMAVFLGFLQMKKAFMK